MSGGLALTSCSVGEKTEKALMEAIVPKSDDVLARRFVDLVRTGDFSCSFEDGDPLFLRQMRQLNRVLDQVIKQADAFLYFFFRKRS